MVFLLGCGDLIIDEAVEGGPVVNPIPAVPTYVPHIEEIMTVHCVRCHGPDLAERGIRLDSYDGVRARANDVVRTTRGASMPPGGPAVFASDVAVIADWVAAGAREGEGEPAPEPQRSCPRGQTCNAGQCVLFSGALPEGNGACASSEECVGTQVCVQARCLFACD